MLLFLYISSLLGVLRDKKRSRQYVVRLCRCAVVVVASRDSGLRVLCLLPFLVFFSRFISFQFYCLFYFLSFFVSFGCCVRASSYYLFIYLFIAPCECACARAYVRNTPYARAHDWCWYFVVLSPPLFLCIIFCFALHTRNVPVCERVRW